MEIIIKNNPMFANFIGERLASQHNIPVMILMNRRTYKASIIPEREEHYSFCKKMVVHMLRLDLTEKYDRTGIKRCVRDFNRSEAVRLS